MQQPTTSDKPDNEREAEERAAQEREAKRQEQIQRNQAAIEMLHEWMQEDPEEQRQTWEVIERGLNKDGIVSGSANLASGSSATELTTRRSLMQQPTTQPDQPSTEALEEQRQEQIRRNQALIDLLNEWDQEDPEEQRETLEFLMRALDEDRPSYRKLFP